VFSATSFPLLQKLPAEIIKLAILNMVQRLGYPAGEFMSAEISRRLFTVHDYYKMVDAGILREGDRVELIRGEVVTMSPIGTRHSAAVLRALNTLFKIVGDRALVGCQGSIRLDVYNEPQPDIYLLRPKDDFYASGHAGPSDLFLIVEMADSSLKYDRTVKMELYAETGVPEYWIADVEHDCLIVYTEPTHGGYRTTRTLHRGSALTPRLLPDCIIPMDVLLP
jgi:Uma2 family endonuclease